MPGEGSWTGGRSRDDPGGVAERTAAALRKGGRAGELGAHVPPDEIDEVRIVATYLASHPKLAVLALEPPPSAEALERFVGGSAERQLDDLGLGAAGRQERAGLRLAPYERQRDRTEPRGDGAAPDSPDLAVAQLERDTRLDGR